MAIYIKPFRIWCDVCNIWERQALPEDTVSFTCTKCFGPGIDVTKEQLAINGYIDASVDNVQSGKYVFSCYPTKGAWTKHTGTISFNSKPSEIPSSIEFIEESIKVDGSTSNRGLVDLQVVTIGFYGFIFNAIGVGAGATAGINEIEFDWTVLYS